MIPKNVYFFGNGNTFVDDGQEQIPELQVAWIKLYFAFLESKGVDVVQCRFHLPQGLECKPFKTENGWNWRVQ